MERQFQANTLAATYPADGMFDVDAVKAPASLEWPLGRADDGYVSKFEWQNHRTRLHARPLLDQHELAPMKIFTGLSQQCHNLQWEHVFTVVALMQC